MPLKELLLRPEFLIGSLVIVGGTIAVLLYSRRSPVPATVPVTTVSAPPPPTQRFIKNSVKGPVKESPEFPTIGFDDVAGIEEAVDELREVKEYLADPARFRELGAKLPKGVLLYGPPGTGKTMLAKALAGEAQVPFYCVSAASFVEVFVGTGASRVRRLFEQAKAHRPAIVFIDELDAVGRRRSTSAIGGTEERESTLNQLLIEMDGFESGEGVLTIAATNRPDVLDPALLRPGRFDRRIGLDLPDISGREQILAVHARGKPFATDVALHEIARRTAQFSGADLANVINEAALLAGREHSRVIRQAHLYEAIERVVAGPARRARVLSLEDRRRIAYHEAGHAVAATALPAGDHVGKVSILPRGQSGGQSWLVPSAESAIVTRSHLLDRITTLLAGKAAEELVFGEPSTGAIDDLSRAAEIARQMVVELGMSGRVAGLFSSGLHRVGPGGLPAAYSERTASEIDAEVQAVLEDAYTRAREVLDENVDVLDEIVDALLEYESIEGAQLDRLLHGIVPANAGDEWGATAGERRAG